MPSKLNIAELDFDAIKNNLKEYLKNQSEFDGYDFEGAGLNILLDVLAYNTHYNSFYLNMIANEMFLDSASLRQSVVSHAKLLGYTPRSTTAATAIVDVTINKSVNDPTTVLSLPRFTSFSSQSLDGQSFQFLSTEEVVASNVGNQFVFSGVRIREGTPSTFVYTVDDSTNPKQVFDLPDENIDTSTLQVVVQRSATETQQETFVLSTNATEVAGDAAVFYLEEGETGKYRIYFGDDIFGRKLKNGNLVAVSYIVTSGVAANGIEKFKLSANPLSGSTASVTTVMRSSAGSVRELVEDIKFTAPKSFISNNRAVTKNDYIALIKQRYPFFDAVNVWGGEEEVPPVYGKVFITAKPKLGFEITESEKEFVKNEIIKPISVLTVTPEFVDANFNYLNLSVNVSYNQNKTNRTAGEIKEAVRAAIVEFSLETLNSFDSKFQLSTLLRIIDDSDSSIVSSTADVFIEKRFSPVFFNPQTYQIKFDAPLTRGATGVDKIFSTPAYKQTDAEGIVRNVFLEETPDSFSGIEQVEIVNPGANYTFTPEVIVVGDGVGAELKAVIVNGRLRSVNVVKPGTGYTTAQLIIRPRVNDLGRGAEARALIQGRTGVIRSFFFDSTGAKRVLDSEAGTIRYTEGLLTLNNFAPEDVDEPLKVLKIFAKPETTDFSSQKATILVLDQFDPNSIKINIKSVK